MLSRLRVATAIGFTVVLLGALGMTSGCSSSGGNAASSGNGAFEITTSQLFISATNRAGLALTNVKVTIVPVARSTPEFSTSYGRMESGERRDFSLGQFRGSDGTPFNLRIHRPRSVKVTGTDLDGKTHEAEVPWQQ